MYQDSIRLETSPWSRYPWADCPDESFRLQLFGKTVQYFFSGLATALLMPIEVLRYLQHGARVRRRAWVSWVLSAAVWGSGFAIWALVRATYFDGQDRTNLMLGSLVALFVAGIVSGRLQTRDRSGDRTHWALRSGGSLDFSHHGHHGHHDHHGHPHGQHGSFPLPFVPDAERGEKPEPARQSSGNCCGNCRECTEEICVKTGRPKQRASN